MLNILLIVQKAEVSFFLYIEVILEAETGTLILSFITRSAKNLLVLEQKLIILAK